MFVQAAMLTLLFTVPDMDLPESILYHNGQLFVANCAEKPWKHDRHGYISLLKDDGQIINKKWRTRTSDAPMSAPKGMCILDGKLYVADIDRVHWFALKGKQSGTISVPKAQKLNDVATNGETVFVSDTRTGQLVHIDPKTGKLHKTKAVEGINGITFHKGQMWAVSWSKHEVYRLDPDGEKPPRPLGIAKQLKSADGIEGIDIGKRKLLIVSDFRAGAVYLLQKGGDDLRTLVKTKTPADIGIDRKHGRLFVPCMRANKIEGYDAGPIMPNAEQPPPPPPSPPPPPEDGKQK